MHSIPALNLWDLIVAVLHGNTCQSNQERRDPHKFPTRKKVHAKIDDLDTVDFISSNVTFVPKSWKCKKQTTVSHSSTESEIISLDTGLRLDGLPALELWDLIVSVLGNVSRVSHRWGQPDNDVHKRHKSQKKIDVMEDIDSVPSNVQSARQEALLYVFRTTKQ